MPLSMFRILDRGILMFGRIPRWKKKRKPTNVFLEKDDEKEREKKLYDLWKEEPRLQTEDGEDDLVIPWVE